MTDETTRVTQHWPVGLKQQVHEVAGSRGVTAYTLAALRERLLDEDRVLTLDREIAELRYLCQLLADRYVMGGTAADRETALMEVELPSWMDTTGWPDALAQQVRKPAPLPPKRPPVAPPLPDEPVGANGLEVFPVARGGDLLSRVQAKAMEKGVDITGVGLVPASEVPTPEPRNHTEVAPEVVPVEAPVEAPVERLGPVGADLYARCPTCGDPLVGQECWTCA